MNFIVYNDLTGRIEGYGKSPAIIPEDAEVGQTVVEGSTTGDDVQYFNTSSSAIVDRPANLTALTAGEDNILADGIDIAHFTSIPSGSSYIISGPVISDGTISGTTLDFSTDTPGTYTVMIESFPELDIEFEVVAT